MSHINQPNSVYFKLIGVGALSVVMLIGCNKTDKPDKSAQPTESETTEVLSPETKTDLIACDDSVALVNLTQSIRGSVTQEVHGQVRAYSERSNTPVNMNKVDSVVNSILIDVASAKPLESDTPKPTNTGMQTCQANLSLTVPTEDIYRASSIYSKLEGGTLQERMEAQHLSLNNNMIVDSTFNYVVGMQGGQTVARIVGQPVVLDVVGDLMAKSQLQVAVDDQRRAMQAAAEKRRREERAARRQAVREQAARSQAERRQTERRQTERSQAQSRPNHANTNSPASTSSTSGNSNLATPKVDSRGQLQAQSTVSSSRQVVDPNAPAKPAPVTKPSEVIIKEAPRPAPSSKSEVNTNNANQSGFSVPKNDNIEIVITEEQGGY